MSKAKGYVPLPLPLPLTSHIARVVDHQGQPGM